MSSLSINSVNPYQYYLQNPNSQSQSNFQNLSNALQSGNLSAAQTAFTALQQTFQNQNGQQSTSQTSQNPTITNDIQNLGNAINSGNLTSAQQAFAQLQKDFQAQGSGHHHHHHGGGGGQAVQSLVASLSQNASTSGTTSSTSGNTLNVTA